MAIYEPVFPDGTPYFDIPLGTNTINVSSSSALSDAMSNASAGDRIILVDGSYSGDFSMSGRSGNGGAGISVEAANVGGASISTDSTFRVTDCSYVTFSGLLFNWDTEGEIFQFRGESHHCRLTRSTFGPTNRSESANSLTWIYVGDECHDIRIDHNEIRNKGTSGNGVRVYGSFDKVDSGNGSDAGCRRVRIDHNLFSNIGPEVGNDKEPVRYGVSTMSRTISSGVIERNVFVDIACEPEVISVKMGLIRTTGNAILQCAGGPVIRHGTNSIMSDNYIIDRVGTVGTGGLASGGIRFYDADHEVSYNYVDGLVTDNFQEPLLLDTGDAEGDSDSLSNHWRVIGADVQRNVIHDCPRGIVIGDNYSSVPRDCTIRDNLVVDVDSGAAITQRVAPSNTVVANNAHYSTPSAAGMIQGNDGVWRKPGYGPRLSLLGPADVGPLGDLDDSDGTGTDGTGSGGGGGGGGIATPADVLNIGDDPGQNHFQLQYALNGSTGFDWTKAEFSEVAAGFAADPYFVVVGAETGSAQTLGVGGTPTASGPNVTLITADSTNTLVITTPGVYDGQGHTVGKIQIEADDVTVQNFYVRGANNAGIYSGPNSNVTIQNCDIAQVNEGGAGDINGITFFGDGTRILYNKIDNLVDGPLNGSHTDGIQTWATASKNSSSNVEIRGNWINGPTNSDPEHIHQAVMAEGPLSTDGGGGGTGVSTNWLVADNYFNSHGDNQCIKFDDIHDVTITRNIFAGASQTICETGSLSTGIDFYSDNVITGDYSEDGVAIIPGPGPGAPTEDRDANAVQFQVRADAATTSGSDYPRSELRETRSDGAEMAFDAMTGTHELHTRARVTHLPALDPEVIVAQLHNGVTGDRISVRTQLISGQTKLLCRINGTQVDPRLSESYMVGTEFEILIRVSNGGFVEIFYQGSSTPIVTGQLESTGGPTWYWKVGAYAQFDEVSAGSSTEYVSVEHRDLVCTHGGYRVDIGADAFLVAGQPFDRPAIETGLTGITHRSWTLIARPTPDPGDPGDPIDMSEAANRHGWGTPLPESDEFNYVGPPNSTKWKLPGESWAGHNGNGRRRPERQTVTGEKLVMTGLANGDSGWMEHQLGQQYGRWEARVRSYANAESNGNDYHPLLLIWPDSNERQQDGEYDFMENFRPGDNHLGAFIHYPHPGTEVVQQEYFETPCDMSQWHNIAMEWTADHIKGYLDGEEWFSVSGGANDVRRDIQDMPSGHGTIQLDNFDGTDQTPATLEVMWYRVYSL